LFGMGDLIYNSVGDQLEQWRLGRRGEFSISAEITGRSRSRD
jgi:hypothetical protein